MGVILYPANLLGLTITSKIFLAPPKETISATPGTDLSCLSMTQSCQTNRSVELRLLSKV